MLMLKIKALKKLITKKKENLINKSILNNFKKLTEKFFFVFSIPDIMKMLTLLKNV